MDAALLNLNAQALSAAPREGGSALQHEALLLLLLPLLPLDARARAACVCRAWRAATAHSGLWEALSFERCAARVSNATLASLCARAGAQLRTLYLDAEACTRVSAAGMLAALRDGGCTGVRRLRGSPRYWFDFNWPSELTAQEVQQLVAACPVLQYAECSLRCSIPDATAALTALPGLVELTCDGEFTEIEEHVYVSVTQLAECLRVNATLKSLKSWHNQIGALGGSQLAECLRFNSTLTNLLDPSVWQLHRQRSRDAAGGVPAWQRRTREPEP